VNTLQAILSRRSVRAYTGQPVPDELLETVLRAAMAAPSAGNQQPWQFVVITERSLLDAIPAFHPYARMVLQAPVAVLLCGDLSLEKHKDYWVQDCSAAMQNMLLAIHASGLGGVWLGVYPNSERVDGFRKLLDLPEHIVPLGLLPFGYPSEQPPAVDRFNPSRIHTNHW